MTRVRSKLLAALATAALFGGLLAASETVDPRLERTVALLQAAASDAQATAKSDYDGNDEDHPIGSRWLAVLPPSVGIEEEEEKEDDSHGGSR